MTLNQLIKLTTLSTTGPNFGKIMLRSYHLPSYRENSADDKLITFFVFVLENMIWHFMQIDSLEDNLHKMSNSTFQEK